MPMQNATQRSTIAALTKQPLILTYAKPSDGPLTPAPGPAGELGAG